MSRILVVVVCAALSARSVQDFVLLAQQDGWDVWVVITPSALSFVDEPLLTSLTRHPVIMTQADTRENFPEDVTAVVVVPATFNTLKKWAQGITDTFALHLLKRWTTQARPILAFPRASSELAQDPDFVPSLASLQAQGVTVVYQPEQYPPNNNIPWQTILDQLTQKLKHSH